MDAINAQEELSFIRKVMEDSRTSYADDGKPKILWAAIVAIGMIYTYIQALSDSDLYIGWVWIGISVIGWSYIFWYKNKFEHEHKVQTQTGKIIGAIWGACGVSIALIIILIFGTRYFDIEMIVHPISLCPLTAIIVGIAYFLDGTVRVVPWVRNLSIVWWLSAVIMFAWPSVHILAFYAFMIIAFQFVPGLILYRQSKQALRTR